MLLFSVTALYVFMYTYWKLIMYIKIIVIRVSMYTLYMNVCISGYDW